MAENKYHISKNGTPSVCKALSGQCPLGGVSEHFDTIEAAQEFGDQKNNIETISETLENASNSSDEKFDKIRTDRAIASLKLKGSRVYKESVENVLNTTSEADGGSTFNPYTNESPQAGFCYSPYPERSKEFNSIDELSISTYNNYLEDNSDLLSKDNHYIGTWNDPATGKIYLDISVNTLDAKEARQQCKDKDQIAYFDLQDFNSVTVDQNATSGQGKKSDEENFKELEEEGVLSENLADSIRDMTDEELNEMANYYNKTS